MIGWLRISNNRAWNLTRARITNTRYMYEVFHLIKDLATLRLQIPQKNMYSYPLCCVWLCTWWRHQMETFSALLAICVGNSPVTGEFPTQKAVRRSIDVFFDLCLNKRLSKQWYGWLFGTPSRLLWLHCNDISSNKKYSCCRSCIGFQNITIISSISTKMLCVTTGTLLNSLINFKESVFIPSNRIISNSSILFNIRTGQHMTMFQHSALVTLTGTPRLVP